MFRHGSFENLTIMENYEQKIKEEIERLKEHTAKCGYPEQGEFENGNREGRNWVCDKLLSFIDSLHEEPASEDLEEELDNFLKDPVFGKLINRNAGIALARHFAEWQKQQIKEALQTEYEKGRFDMREEIMKGTVLETKVMMDCDGDGIETPYEEWLTLENTEIPYIPNNLRLKEGDKVQLIIVKTEQQ